MLAAFAARGVPDLDADALAHGVMPPGSRGDGRIAARFGADVLGADGARRSPGARRRSCSPTPAARRDLEAIVHPAVYRAIDAWFAAFEPRRDAACRGRHPAAVRDRPRGRLRRVDRHRLPAGGAAAAARCARRLSARPRRGSASPRRWPTEEKVARADYVVMDRRDVRGDRRQVERDRRATLQSPRRSMKLAVLTSQALSSLVVLAPARSAPRRTCSSRGSAGTARAARCCGSGSACRRAGRGRRPRRA